MVMKNKNNPSNPSKLVLLLCGLLYLSAGLADLHAQRTPVIIEGKETLPLRVLTRPFSSVYADANENASLVQENLPAFQPLYVYTRPEISDFDDVERWYEVGSDDKGTVLGWMKADDVMEWKQAMCLSYTHPEGRDPVMMFRTRGDLLEVAEEDPNTRFDQVVELQDALELGSVPNDFPLVSVEPKRAIFQFIEEQFYLLPILQYEEIEIDGIEGRVLQLAAATTAAGGRGSTTLEDKEFVQSAVADTSAESASLKDLKLDVVYVIDTSASMQPYIDGTRRAIRNVAEEIAADPEIAENVRFGVLAFRDSTEIEGIEYLTRNFTPDLQNASTFASTLERVDDAKVGSKGFAEDVFAGIDEALTETEWTEGSMRFIVLIGDAPSHPKGHIWNASGKGAEELNQMANDARVSIIAVHIKDPRAAQFHDLTEQQFMTLSANRGSDATGESAYLTVRAKDDMAFDTLSQTILGVFKDTLAMARGTGSVAQIMEVEEIDDFAEDIDEQTASVSEIRQEASAVASSTVRAALVDWIGKSEGVRAPRDIVAWVVDKDLKDPFVPSLEVRVLINKNQLDSLRTVLQELMLAGRQGQMSGAGFFDALQATSATLTVTPEQIRTARTIADTGLVPEFLQDLPYKSRIMGMTNDDWNSWSQDQQDEFLNDLDAKIAYYGALHDESDVWVALNQGDDPDAYVHPVSLEMLP